VVVLLLLKMSASVRVRTLVIMMMMTMMMMMVLSLGPTQGGAESKILSFHTHHYHHHHHHHHCRRHWPRLEGRKKRRALTVPPRFTRALHHPVHDKKGNRPGRRKGVLAVPSTSSNLKSPPDSSGEEAKLSAI